MSSTHTTSTFTKPKTVNGPDSVCLNNNKDKLINKVPNNASNEELGVQQYFVRFENAIKVPSLTTRNNKVSNESKGFSKLDSYFKHLEKQKANNQLDQNNNKQKSGGQNQKPPKNLLGMFLEDTSSIKYTEEDKTNIYNRFCKMNIMDEMRMFPYINEEEYLNSDKSFNYLMDYLSKFNNHYLLNRSVWQFETKNKLISFLEGLIEKNRSISDSLAVSNEHNAAIAFNIWKLNDLVENMKNKTMKISTKLGTAQDKPILTNSTNKRSEYNENLLSTSSENLNLFDESLNSFEDKELLNNIMKEIGDTSNLVLTSPNNLTGTMPPKALSMTLQTCPDNMLEQTTANLNKAEERCKIDDKKENQPPISINSVNFEELLEKDPRYEYFINNFISLIVDVIQKLSDFNLEYVNYLLDRQKCSVSNDCFDSFYQKRFRLVLENKKKQYKKDVDDNSKIMELLNINNLKEFLRRKLLTYLNGNNANQNEHANPIEMFMAIKSEYEKVKESLNNNQHYVKMKLFQAKFSHSLIQFKLFIHEIFIDHLLLNYKTYKLDENFVEKITSTVRPISTMIPLEASEALKDPRKKSNKFDVDLLVLKFTSESLWTTENNFIELSHLKIKQYKYCKVLDELIWNECEKFPENEPILIDDDLEKLENFAKSKQIDGTISVKHGPIKIPLDANDLLTQNNHPVSIDKIIHKEANTDVLNDYQEMISSTPVFEKLGFLKDFLESNEKNEKRDFNFLLDQENETFDSNMILETPRYQPNTSGLTAKSSTSSFENDLIFSQREIEAFDSNILPKTPIYKPNSSKSSSAYENDLLINNIFEKTSGRKDSIESDDDINATLTSLVEKVIDNIENPEIEDVSVNLNKRSSTVVISNEEEYKNIIEGLKNNFTSSIQQESSLISNSKNKTIEETVEQDVNDNNDLNSNKSNNIIETRRVLRQRKRTRSMTRNENNNSNNNNDNIISRSTSPVELRQSNRRQSRISLPIVSSSNQKHLYKYSSLSNSNYDTRTPKECKRAKKSLDIICQNIILDSNETNKLKLSNSKSKLNYSTRSKDKLEQTETNTNMNQILVDEQSLKSFSENFALFKASQPLPILSNEHLQQFLTESDLQHYTEK